MSDSVSLPPSYFDALYERDADPWQFATSDYERAKYAATLAALPARQFASGFEVGCSIGVLTQRLAQRCGTLLAVDVAEAALARARARCAGMDHVTLRRMRVPGEWPAETFDLILLSEVLYYLSPADLVLAAKRTFGSLRHGGCALLVHYTLPTNYPLGGDAAAEEFIANSNLIVCAQRREAEYRLDCLVNL